MTNTIPLDVIMNNYSQNTRTCVESCQHLCEKFSDAAVNPNFTAEERNEYADKSLQMIREMHSIIQKDAFVTVVIGFCVIVVGLAAKQLCA